MTSAMTKVQAASGRTLCPDYFESGTYTPTYVGQPVTLHEPSSLPLKISTEGFALRVKCIRQLTHGGECDFLPREQPAEVRGSLRTIAKNLDGLLHFVGAHVQVRTREGIRGPSFP
jgi:hypothetical protein